MSNARQKRSYHHARGIVCLIACILGPAVGNAWSVSDLESFRDPASGVMIIFGEDNTIFPKTWQTSKVKAKAGRFGLKAEAERSLKAVKIALEKYPPEFLKKNLKSVYLVRSLSLFGKSTRGTNSSTSVYIANLGKRRGYTNSFIESSFHSELSSILLRNSKKMSPRINWLKVNPPGFKYDKQNPSKARGNAVQLQLHKAGFWTPYATSTFENDFNSIATQLFMNKKSFWETIQKYPKLDQKVGMTIKFYSQAHASQAHAKFTRDFFKAL
jgi:hypothetical protein